MLKSIVRKFGAQVIARGYDYYLRNAVTILEVTPSRLTAEVKGTKHYMVLLGLDEKGLLTTCSCPYSESGKGYCKHIWATMLQARAEGLIGTDEEMQHGFMIDDDDGRPLPRKDRLPRPSARAAARKTLLESIASRSERPAKLPKPAAPRKPAPPPKPGWQRELDSMLKRFRLFEPEQPGPWQAGREIFYLVTEPQGSDVVLAALPLRVAVRDRRKDGTWGAMKSERILSSNLSAIPSTLDRQALGLLLGARGADSIRRSYYDEDAYSTPAYFSVPAAASATLLEHMAKTGRLLLERNNHEHSLVPLLWDDGPAWEFRMEIQDVPGDESHHVLGGCFERGEERLPLEAARLVVRGALLVTDTLAARFLDSGESSWIPHLLARKDILLPVEQADAWLGGIAALPSLPRINFPASLPFERIEAPPQPAFRVSKPGNAWERDWLEGELSFQYGSIKIREDHAGQRLVDPARRQVLIRDPAAEQSAMAQLAQLGVRRPAYWSEDRPVFEVAQPQLAKVARILIESGWSVEAEGRLYQRASSSRLNVVSGIDWFEVHGEVQFGESTAGLPELLKALKTGQSTVKLGDGSYGVLPEEWLRRFGKLASMGEIEGDHLRLRRSQIFLIDAYLESLPDATFDEATEKARRQLARFQGIRPMEPSKGFQGELRDYQKEGLGWMRFLEEFGLGGCLADDMGLGKTVQVLALLEMRRQARGESRSGTSLVVVPRSLIFNWVAEAARFAPKLRILDHTGLGRTKPGEHFAEFDMILTTYGTLRRDALEFKNVEFDYVILDEAQNIKNSKSVAAKAARLLRARHRLALSGTPFENHLGELWSLFEFLNPGMLGKSSNFGGETGPRAVDGPDDKILVARALRPLILRRTKEQVAKDLPKKTEQLIHCDMEPAQRKLYDEIRDHYRGTLLGRVDPMGLGKSQMIVLEALLRLRQVACHPGLLDPNRLDESSAKLDVLMPRIQEVVAEGHKALVFSQFTSFLAIVRKRVEAEGIPYDYLDGATRNRQECVERFQNAEGGRLFLISLKAGGLGLNLTSAEYVFLLDPWWNPAVEAQAIDRTHRIGQQKPVFACRLIARGTVEEKVLELQKSKRALVDAVLGEETSLLKNLTREDLEILLS